jgi:predicted transposase/invertase (TIGR01784 family)
MYERFDPLIDFVFKRIFGDENNKDILIDFLNAELKYDSLIEDVELLNAQIDKNSIDDKLSVLDINARLKSGELINIEVQTTNEANIEKRSLYYWSKLYGGQLTEGKLYSKLRKTICINILNFNILPGENFQSIFHIKEDTTGFKLIDDLEIHMIEMPKFTLEAIDFDDKLKNWLMFLRDPNSKSMEVVMEKTPEIKKAVRVLDVLAQDRNERMLYEKRKLAIIHYESNLESAAQKGKLEGIYTVAQNMKKNGYSVIDISKNTGLSEEEINKL